MITGQHLSTHGVWMNGVPLPVDAPSVAAGAARRRLPHRDHRQAALRAVPRPVPALRREPLRPRAARRAPTAASSTSSPPPTAARAAALRPLAGRATTPRPSACSTRCSTARWRSTRSAAATPARRRCRTTPSRRSGTTPTGWPTARSPGSTRCRADDDWFCWMSFPDPHHPWDPPKSELGPHRLARRAAARRLPADGGGARGHPRRQAAPLAGLVRRHAWCATTRRRTTGCRRR